MTVASFKKADGSGRFIENIFVDFLGIPVTLSDFYIQSNAVPVQVFFEYLPTTTPKNTGRIFRVTGNGYFIATDQRTFNTS